MEITSDGYKLYVSHIPADCNVHVVPPEEDGVANKFWNQRMNELEQQTEALKVTHEQLKLLKHQHTTMSKDNTYHNVLDMSNQFDEQLDMLMKHVINWQNEIGIRRIYVAVVNNTGTDYSVSELLEMCYGEVKIGFSIITEIPLKDQQIIQQPSGSYTHVTHYADGSCIARKMAVTVITTGCNSGASMVEMWLE